MKDNEENIIHIISIDCGGDMFNLFREPHRRGRRKQDGHRESSSGVPIAVQQGADRIRQRKGGTKSNKGAS